MISGKKRVCLLVEMSTACSQIKLFFMAISFLENFGFHTALAGLSRFENQIWGFCTFNTRNFQLKIFKWRYWFLYEIIFSAVSIFFIFSILAQIYGAIILKLHKIFWFYVFATYWKFWAFVDFFKISIFTIFISKHFHHLVLRIVILKTTLWTQMFSISWICVWFFVFY